MSAAMLLRLMLVPDTTLLQRVISQMRSGIWWGGRDWTSHLGQLGEQHEVRLVSVFEEVGLSRQVSKQQGA